MSQAPPEDVAVRVAGLSKTFRIPHEQANTLKERALRPLRGSAHDELRALRDVSIDVARGEFFGIVGRNGSGKSTLMKCMAGIYAADAGEMWVRGRLATFIELGVGFNPNLTARDNVRVNGIMLGLTPREADARYDAIVDFAELRDFVDLKLKNYSSGMHVRLAFSVMAHVDADVLLIDEVLAVGDAAFQQRCHDALTEMSRNGKTIVLVSHDMGAVQRFCSRGMLLDGGELVTVGDSREIAREYHEVNLSHSERVVAGAPATDTGAAVRIIDTWVEQPAGVRADSLAHDEDCVLRLRVEFRERVERPVFGFVLTNWRGEAVFAGTSGWDGSATGTQESGTTLDVGFRFANVLASGRYFVSPEVGHAAEFAHAIDRREGATSFVVHGAREGSGTVDLPLELELAPTQVAGG